jgi:N6-adenosine-specific RNA methylase IME4
MLESPVQPSIGKSVPSAATGRSRAHMAAAQGGGGEGGVAPAAGDHREGWARHINEAWRQSLDAIFETGHRLILAQHRLSADEFEKMLAQELLFGPRTAQMLMKIAHNWEYRFAKHVSFLPPSWGTLYELTKLKDAEFQALLGRIRPDTEREEVVAWRHALRRDAKEDAHRALIVGGLIEDLQRFIDRGHRVGTIYADPPWLYDNQATRSATRNVFDGMTVEELYRLPVGELALDDAHLHLWTTNGFLRESFELFDAWGFEFKSSFIWIKPQLGIGNYWRNAHEFLLTGVRGGATRFNDRTLKSWLDCKRGKHSRKPYEVRDFIERASPGPWLEMFAREPAPRWLSWGHEIPASLLSQGQEWVA